MLVWLGAFLLFAGFAIRFMLPHKRVWGRIVARAERRRGRWAWPPWPTRTSRSGTEFDNLVTDIRAALQAPAQA